MSSLAPPSSEAEPTPPAPDQPSTAPPDRNGHLAARIGGALLILVGLALFVGQFLRIDFWHFAWPLMIVGGGLAFFVAAFLGGRPAAGLAVPGGVITTIGLILFVQNLTNQWQTWAYVWALIPAGAGAGVWLQGALTGSAKLRTDGRNLVTTGLILLAGFGAFFEVVLNLSGYFATDLARFIWPVLLIAAGLYLLVRRAGQVRAV